jgi:hypothetical protein
MDIWVGIACLKPDPRVKGFRRFGDGKGAYVNVVAWAESPKAFEEQVRRQSASLDCILVELEEVELLEVRMQADDYPDEFIDMRQTAIRQPTDTVFGTFYTWDQEDSN